MRLSASAGPIPTRSTSPVPFSFVHVIDFVAMCHDLAHDVAYARQALILAGERLDRVEAALAKDLPAEPVKTKRRKGRQPKPARKPEGGDRG